MYEIANKYRARIRVGPGRAGPPPGIEYTYCIFLTRAGIYVAIFDKLVDAVKQIETICAQSGQCAPRQKSASTLPRRMRRRRRRFFVYN